ncbi:Rieske (2Fe-2S) protein [Mycobacterium doricum]|uniref:Rieske domain-containing protein n=1 Tax=Mycolicibacterium doricum TaxID=126673 RepID=A0A1X1TDL1_9MYCO|nr:Rieske (2Fe-2S) protein [Mycolicibacterium doricum]ORV42619.1 hypothetical protein AWC01_07790 [Mycolicibacterium doricum]
MTWIPKDKNVVAFENASVWVLRQYDDNSVAAHSVVCRHRGGPLNLGTICEGFVTCPWHKNRTRIPRAGTKRMPFVFAKGPAGTYVVGPLVSRTMRMSVL